MRTTKLPSALLLLITLPVACALGCNGLTGISDVVLTQDDGEDGGGDGDGGGDDDDGTPSHAAAGPSGAGGSGQATSTGQGTSTTAGAGGGGPSTGATTTSAATTGSGPLACEYPAGNYGNSQGATLDPSYSWSVYLENASSMSAMSPEDLFDCDGTRGTNAILIVGGITNCGACQAEANDIPAREASWAAQGIRVVYLMFDGNATEWRSYFGLEDIVVGNDPTYSLIAGGGGGTPINLVVDPRDMRVVMRQNGYGGSLYQTLEGLAQQNGE